jgi:hypothetical protein
VTQKTSGIKWTSIIASVVACISLVLNIIQYYGTKSFQKQEFYNAEVFFAFANDHTILRLFSPPIRDNPPKDQLAFEYPVDHEVTRMLQKYAKEAQTSTQIVLRSKPVVSFLVVHNRGKHEIREFMAFTYDSQLARESVILKKPMRILPNESLLVPLDFRLPGNDANEPNLPAKVIVRYEGGTIEVMERERTSWLGDRFVRALISSKRPD